MKVPSPIAPSTQRSNQRMARAQTPQGLAAFAGVGEAAAKLGASIELYSEKVRAQERLRTKQSLSDWRFETARQIEELRRSTPEDDTTYFTRAQELLDKRESEFLDNVDPRLVAEMEPQIRDNANAFRLQELQFDSERKDVYSRGVITRATNQSALEVNRDAAQLAAQRQHLHDMIDASTLSAAEKASQKRLVDVQLEKVGYATRVREEHLDRDSLKGGIDSFIDRVFTVESSNDPRAKNPKSTATGLGQFIEKTWLQFIREEHPELINQIDVLALRKDPEFAREATEWYAEKNARALERAGVPVNEGTLYLSHFADGPVAARIYNADPNTPIKELIGEAAYNANDFLQGKTAGWLVDWAYQKMGREDAYSRVDYDPEFSNLPFEDRIAIRADVARVMAGERTAEQKQREDERRSRVDQLYLGLYDGTFGRQHIAEARERGDLASYDEVNKANSILDKRQEEQSGAAFIVDRLTENAPAPLTDDLEQHWKSMDDFAKVTGLNEGIESMDPNVKGNMAYLAERLQLWPRTSVQLLNAGALSRDWQRSSYSLDTLSDMYGRQPDLLRKMTTDAELQRVLTYRALKPYMPDTELQHAIQNFNNPELRESKEALRSEGRKWLSDKGYTSETILNEFSSLFIMGEEESQIPTQARTAFHGEFREIFAEFYARTVDADAAWDASIEMMRRNWGFHNDGEANRFMRYPPESFVPELAGSHDLLSEAIREELGIIDDNEATYALLSDQQTAHEAEMFRSGQRTKPPSYVAHVVRDGFPQELPKRYIPDYLPRHKAEVKDRFDLMELTNQRVAALRELRMAREMAVSTGTLQDPKLTEELEARVSVLSEQILELETKLDPPREPLPEVDWRMSP